MKRQGHSKSGLFILELLINLLLFCFLCGCGLKFFIKSNTLTQDSVTLHNAVRITSSIAAIYESGDGSLHPILDEYTNGVLSAHTLTIYFDKNYNPCPQNEAIYSASAAGIDSDIPKIDITFYNQNKEAVYTIRACNYTPATLDTAKEVRHE